MFLNLKANHTLLWNKSISHWWTPPQGVTHKISQQSDEASQNKSLVNRSHFTDSVHNSTHLQTTTTPSDKNHRWVSVGTKSNNMEEINKALHNNSKHTHLLMSRGFLLCVIVAIFILIALQPWMYCKPAATTGSVSLISGSPPASPGGRRSPSALPLLTTATG